MDNPYEGIRQDLALLLGGQPLGRAMTEMERLCLAVADAEPTNYLTLDSKDLSRAGIGEEWSKLDVLK